MLEESRHGIILVAQRSVGRKGNEKLPPEKIACDLRVLARHDVVDARDLGTCEYCEGFVPGFVNRAIDTVRWLMINSDN